MQNEAVLGGTNASCRFPKECMFVSLRVAKTICASRVHVKEL